MRPRYAAWAIGPVAILYLSAVLAVASPQSQVRTFLGRVQAAEVDEFDKAAGVWRNRRVLLLNTHDGDLIELESPPAEIARSPVGRQINVTGVLRGQKLVIEGFEAPEASDAGSAQAPSGPMREAAPETIGAQKTLVALFNFSDVPNQPFSIDSVREKLLTAARSTDNFLRENSGGKAWLDVDFVDWKTLQANSNELCPGST